MHYLYGSKRGVRKLVATFGSEQQLLAYIGWATLSEQGRQLKFEQGSALAGFEGWSSSAQPLGSDDPQAVQHNPSPNML